AELLDREAGEALGIIVALLHHIAEGLAGEEPAEAAKVAEEDLDMTAHTRVRIGTRNIDTAMLGGFLELALEDGSTIGEEAIGPAAHLPGAFLDTGISGQPGLVLGDGAQGCLGPWR